jgi:hypothetical protein
MEVDYRQRSTLYDMLAYYAARADAAWEAQNVWAAQQWMVKYHRLRQVIEGK